MFENFQADPKKVGTLALMMHEVQTYPHFYLIFILVGAFIAGPLGVLFGWVLGKIF